MSRGIPIVSEKWIIDIENKNQLTATNDYLINDQNSEKRYKFSLSQSLKMAKNKPLYCNYSIIVTPSTKPTPQELNGKLFKFFECTQTIKNIFFT